MQEEVIFFQRFLFLVRFLMMKGPTSAEAFEALILGGGKLDGMECRIYAEYFSGT